MDGQIWIFFKVGLLSPLFDGKIGSLYAGSNERSTPKAIDEPRARQRPRPEAEIPAPVVGCVRAALGLPAGDPPGNCFMIASVSGCVALRGRAAVSLLPGSRTSSESKGPIFRLTRPGSQTKVIPMERPKDGSCAAATERAGEAPQRGTLWRLTQPPEILGRSLLLNHRIRRRRKPSNHRTL